VRTWEYKGEELTLEQLYNLPECKVTKVELQRNLSRKKLDVEISLVTEVKSVGRAAKVHFLHGMYLSAREVSDLNQCEVSYWILLKHLREGHPIEEAIKRSPKPLIKRKVKKYIKTDFTSTLVELGSPYSKAQGGQIKIFNQERCHYPIEESWEYRAAKKLNNVLEQIKSERELRKTLNEEDQKTKN
jgi:hypothetical protein